MNDRLAAAAGPEGVIAPEQWPRFAVAGSPPMAVVAPATVEAAAAVMALCSDEGWPVEPAGTGSWLSAGRTPAAAPVVVSTARLRRIREYEPADLVVGVEAGLPFGDLQALLATNGQTVPLDPPGADRGTLAAAASLACAGPLRAAHGTPRDIVLGVEVVTGDARILHFGGRVVKNVAGFDITRLLVGSRGSLGIITALYTRLRARPDLDSTLRATLPSESDAVALADEVRRRMEPDALELIDPALTHDFAAAEPGGWSVIVRIRGSAAATDEASARLAGISRDFVRLDPPVASRMWQGLSDAEARASIAIRLVQLPAMMGELLRMAQAFVDNASSGREIDEVTQWRTAAHAASGIVRVWADRPAPANADRLAEALRQLASQVVKNHGTVTCPVLPRGFPVPDLARPTDAELRIGRALKERFDPAGVMSPGRHLAGL